MPRNILAVLFEDMNTMDINGPLEVLFNSALRENGVGPFKLTTCALEGKPIKAAESITMNPDISFDEAISCISNGEFDILLMPGCPSGPESILQNPDHSWGAQPPLLKVLQAFMAHDNASAEEKWMVSICTGAWFMGAAGAFKGRNATTHWAVLSKLGEICKAYDASPLSITKRRYVDGGYMNPQGSSVKPTRIVSAGGISCGLDCSLWLVEQILGVDAALNVAETMDYARRNDGGGFITA